MTTVTESEKHNKDTKPVNDAVKVMVVEDTIDTPVKTLEVTATGNKYTNTPSKKDRSSRKIENFSTIDENGVLTEMVNIVHQDVHNYDNNCYQAYENNDITQKDKQSDEKLPTKSKWEIQPENNLRCSVFFCSEGCFQQTSDNKVVSAN